MCSKHCTFYVKLLLNLLTHTDFLCYGILEITANLKQQG